MKLNSNEIASLLPHRYPFALVDRIVDGEPGQWAKGIKCVSVNEQFFCGHFPQEHVMPGVLILEAMAQVGCVALMALPENRGRIALFGGVKKCQIPSEGNPGRCAGDGMHAHRFSRRNRVRKGQRHGRRRDCRNGGADLRPGRVAVKVAVPDLPAVYGNPRKSECVSC